MNSKFINILLYCSILAISSSGRPDESRLPNIVFILADDMGRSHLGCYGSTYYPTPNIDKLASEGMQFFNAYAAAAICSPSRASIMTGKYPARLHITDFIPGNVKTDYPLIEPGWQKFLPLAENTFAELIKEKGYSSALFGKWHLSRNYLPPESLEHNPDKQGFDETFITHKPSSDLAQSWQDAENDAHNVDTLTSLAINFMERNKNRPFMLFISHNSIHDPLKERSATIQKYSVPEATKEPENHPVIAAMVERLDNSCGKIFAKIAELGIEDNTIIVFFSDNGGRDKYAAQKPFRAGKGWLYEGGIRVPLIIKWKNKITQGSISSSMVCSTDFFPTIMELTGVADYPQVDGKSIIPILKNPENVIHETLYWHYPHYHVGSGMIPAGAIRQGKWKLIEWYEKSLTGESDHAFELYDVENDEGETNNLVTDYPEKVMELADQLKKWREETKAQMPVINNQSNRK